MMTKNLNYISDDELERLICQVEENELVAAPPDLMESILETVEFTGGPEILPTEKVIEVSAVTRKKEFYAYCFRVITSVAAAVALVFLLPEITTGMNLNETASQKRPEKSEVVQTVPSYDEIVEQVPSRAEVVASKSTPTKDEVLNDTGFIEKVINSTAEWLKKEKDN